MLNYRTVPSLSCIKLLCQTIDAPRLTKKATPALAAHAKTEAIYKGEKFSDHAPITIEYDFSL